VERDKEYIELGKRTDLYGTGTFGMKPEDRRLHTFVIGRTGVGKSTLLWNTLVQDAKRGRGFAFIDPHGDDAERLLDHIPKHRSDHVVYFNPSDLEYPVGFNPLACKESDATHLVVSGLISSLKHIYRDSWGPRMEYLLTMALLAVTEAGGTTMLAVLRIFTDSDYRRHLLARVHDQVVLDFWQNEYESYNERFKTEAVAPIQNKLGKLLASPPLRNIFEQPRSKIDLRFMMDNNRILIANLSKGKLGEDSTALLGSLLISQFQIASMSRADQPENERKDFSLVVDEFHNFTTDSFASMLSELRKYRLSLTLASQYLSQISPDVRSAVLGNVGTLISFAIGADDAEVLAPHLEHPPEALIDLDPYEVLVRQTSGGATMQPFRATTCAPMSNHCSGRDNLIRLSRERYARPRDQVEMKLNRWLRRTYT